jgi:hypothetical protein
MSGDPRRVKRAIFEVVDNQLRDNTPLRSHPRRNLNRLVADK